MVEIEQILRAINQIFEAGIAITALSLFLRSLSFNLRDRVSQSFAVVLACTVVIFSGEAISGAVMSSEMISNWLRFQWLGIVFLPPALQHFSDSLLATTGRPSRGRRRRVILASYTLSAILTAALFSGYLLGPTAFDGAIYPHPTQTSLSVIFTIYYLISIILASVWIWRAYRRTKLRVSRRRITYSLIGVIFLALGSYPYMQLGSSFAQQFSILFIGLVIIGNLGIFLCLLLMAYAVAFFGVPWPDRIVRSRLLKWVLRGPITVFVMLFLITLTNQLNDYLGAPYMVAIPIVSVISVMFSEHIITLIFPYIDRWLLQRGDGDQYYLLQSLSERLVSAGDLRQFLEAILAGACDQFQVTKGFVAAVEEDRWEIVVRAGNLDNFEFDSITGTIKRNGDPSGKMSILVWGDYWLCPLYNQDLSDLIGLMGVFRDGNNEQPEEELADSLVVLGHRASMALEDRQLQRKVLMSLQELSPKVALIQRLRAAFRFDQSEVLRELADFEPPKDFSQWVKDALSHYWGGPKLTGSPLLDLHVVQESLQDHDYIPVNALRTILRDAMEQVKPNGDKKFTPEWILYNILEMKFLEGRKVKEIAKRLAVSEADLYRKQRIAIEAVATTIIKMEMKSRGT
jgi:hypothetical protein